MNPMYYCHHIPAANSGGAHSTTELYAFTNLKPFVLLRTEAYGTLVTACVWQGKAWVDGHFIYSCLILNLFWAKFWHTKLSFHFYASFTPSSGPARHSLRYNNVRGKTLGVSHKFNSLGWLQYNKHGPFAFGMTISCTTTSVKKEDNQTAGISRWVCNRTIWDIETILGHKNHFISI